MDTAPSSTRAIPISLERSDGDAGGVVDGMCWVARRLKKSPKRATTNPKPMMVSPVRIHARRVRSAAKKTRGSDMCMLINTEKSIPICESA